MHFIAKSFELSARIEALDLYDIMEHIQSCRSHSKYKQHDFRSNLINSYRNALQIKSIRELKLCILELYLKL